MLINQEAYSTILTELAPYQATLVAVSKTKPKEAILDMYQLGQRDFGENYVQELVDKAAALPKDIHWHFIGHLQSNKVKYIAPFVYLIHGVDSHRLLLEIQKQALKQNRVIDVLLQMHIASEDTKFGLDEAELKELLEKVKEQPLSAVRLRGLMGMASFTDDPEKVRAEFRQLKRTFDNVKGQTPDPTLFTLLSMGMSSDYPIAIQEGSNLVRIGSLLFGAR